MGKTRERQRKRLSTIIGVTALLAASSCTDSPATGSTSGPVDEPRAPIVLEAEPAAHEFVDDLRARFRLAGSIEHAAARHAAAQPHHAHPHAKARPVIRSTRGSRFVRQGDRVVPQMVHDVRGLQRSLAEASLPRLAHGQVVLAHDDLSAAIRFRLEGGSAQAEMVDGGGVALYRDALGRGYHWLHRIEADSIEDFVYFRTRPEQHRVHYRVDVGAVEGLRLVGNVLEFLDAQGAPKLRMTAPFLATEVGTVETRVSVSSCRVDRDPLPPWGRAVTAPGSSTCRVTVSWDPDWASFPALLDPTWETTGSMTQARAEHTATLLNDGRVLVTSEDTAELYDPASKTFAATPNMAAVRAGHTATLLADGRVFVAGGTAGTPSAEVYDPAAGTWSSVAAALNDARVGHSAERLTDGRVMLIGGGALESVEIFDPSTESFALGPKLPAPRPEHASITLNDGRILVVGGAAGPLLSDTAWTAWVSTSVPALDGRRSHTLELLPDGRVMMIAGLSSDLSHPPALESAQVFSPATDTWSAPHYMGGPRSFLASVALSTGAVLVTGGMAHSDHGMAQATSEVIGGEGAFVFTGWMDVARTHHEATLLQDHSVLITGGKIEIGLQGTDAAELLVLDPLGTPCSSAAPCGSGNCVDGVCCDSPCDGSCEACGSEGSAGTCRAVPADTDPDAECAVAAPEGCGNTGMCDGAGRCQQYPEGTPCSAPVCAGAEARTWTCADGACSEKGTSCAPYACSGAGCATSCGGDHDCAGAAWCSAAKSGCEPDRGPQEACQRDAQCLSALCVGGRCGTAAACLDERTFIDIEGAPIDCAPFACGLDGCFASCRSVNECGAGHVCDEAARCVPTGGSTSSGSCGFRPLYAQRSGREPLGWILLLGLGLAVRRRRSAGKQADGIRRKAAIICASVVVAAPGCDGSSFSEPPSGESLMATERTIPSSEHATTFVEAVGRGYRLPLKSVSTLGAEFHATARHRAAMPPGEAVRFERTPTGWHPSFSAGQDPKTDVVLPAHANEPVELRHAPSGMGVTITLQEGTAAVAQEAHGLLVYPGALGQTADLVHRCTPSGNEDFLLFHRAPALSSASFRIRLHDVAGLRLIGHALELLDAQGTPRLRMNAPYLVPASDGSSDAMPPAAVTTRVEGCAYDVSPRPPWGRRPMSPGAEECILVLSWDPQVAYPLLLDPAWVAADQMAHARGSAGTVLPDGRILFVGGSSSPIPAELFDPNTNSFALVGTPTHAYGGYHAAALLADGRVLVAGDYDLHNAAEVYDGGTFAEAPPMAEARRFRPGVATLKDGRVLVAGGGFGLGAEIFTPNAATGTWSAVPAASAIIDSPTLMLHGDKVLSVGPRGTQLYDPVAEAWSLQPGMPTPRYGATVIQLPNQDIIVSGGYSSLELSVTGAVEVFTPPVGTGPGSWRPLPPMAGRSWHQGVLMASGDVMHIGGQDIARTALNDVIFYRPETGLSSKTYPLPIVHKGSYTATKLQDGRILVTGGKAAELLTPAALGDVCEIDGECASGICVESMCCTARCDGACRSCAAAVKGHGQDGTCDTVAKGLPHPACQDEGVSSCGETGLCAEAGTCDVYAAGNSCGLTTCSDDTLFSSTCGSNGGCVQASRSCAPFACASADACASNCTAAAGCANDSYCAAGGLCEKKGAIGASCSEGDSCASGACVDQRCQEASSCLDDQRLQTPNGKEVDCAPYRCAGGRCPVACGSALDCMRGSVCNDNAVCIPVEPPSGESGGCSVGRSPQLPPLPSWLVLTAAAALVRRCRSFH